MNKTKEIKKVGFLQNSAVKHKLIIVLALVAICAVFQLLKPTFLSYTNIMTILLATSVNGILALGVAWTIMTGGIDISIGTVMTFSCICSGLLFNAGILLTMAGISFLGSTPNDPVQKVRPL